MMALTKKELKERVVKLTTQLQKRNKKIDVLIIALENLENNLKEFINGKGK